MASDNQIKTAVGVVAELAPELLQAFAAAVQSAKGRASAYAPVAAANRAVSDARTELEAEGDWRRRPPLAMRLDEARAAAKVALANYMANK